MMRGAQRGQALAETMLALPLVILSLVFLLWCGKHGVLAERVESTARYTQQVLNSSNIYQQYSLFSLYDASADGPVLGAQSQHMCANIDPNVLSTQSFVVGGSTIGGSSLWQTDVKLNNCISGPAAVTDAVSRPTVLGYSHQDITIGATGVLNTGSILFGSGENGTAVINSGTLSDLTSAPMSQLMKCYPTLASALNQSLWAGARGLQDGTPITYFSNSDIGAQAPTSALLIGNQCT